jgi:tetratricopeptide (TPR) repeat protein
MLCIGKICVSAASVIGTLHGDAPLEHLKEIFEAISSSGEAAKKLRGPDVPKFHDALQASQKTLEQAYAESLKNSHSAGFDETVALAFANLGEVFETCMPRGQQLAKLNHDPESIGNFVADAAVARQIDAFREGEGRKLLVALVVLAYTSLDSKPEFMAALRRVNWKEAFEQLADIKRDTAAMRAQLVADSIKLDELLALARSGGAFQRAREEGIPEAAVRAIVERLGGQGIGRDDLLSWLNNWIDAALRERVRNTNEGEAFEAAWREADRRFRAGQKQASAALIDEYNRHKRVKADREVEERRYGVKVLETAIRIDELQLDSEGVVSKLRELADVEGCNGANEVAGFLFKHARKFYQRGRELGENPALLMAIAIYRVALEDRTRNRVPLDWAMTQNNLGIALATLGDRESGTARLEEAVTAFRAALREFTRERVPLDWAMTQNNLGNTLATLGDRESGTARLEEAVTAFGAALEEHTRERVPLDWAMTQNNLGNAFTRLGERENGTARLEKAVTAYRAALEEYTRERVPLGWAGTQSNLGNALATLGDRESGTARSEEAVTALRAALTEYTRERAPLDWARTQNNLGNALQTLGERKSGTRQLEEAVKAYRAALNERTRDRVPLDWAMTQNNLGNALQTLGERESGKTRLEEAVAAYRAALEEYTRERVPLDWAMTQNNLGKALARLGERESGTARLEEAVTVFRSALEERTRERVPWHWQMTQQNLDVVLQLLDARRSS